MYSRKDLRSLQVRAVAHGMRTPKCAWFVDMGYGKTVAALTLVSDLLAAVEVRKVLIVAPLRVALTVWEQEAARWSHTSHLKFTQLAGLSLKSRTTKLSSQTEIHIINIDLAQWLIKTLGKQWGYDLIIVDESDTVKSASSQRFKAFKKVAPLTTRIVELTGTPMPNGYLDLWSQIALLDGGLRLGKTMSAYKTKFFTSDYMGYNWELKEGAEEKIQQLISDLCFTVPEEEYIKLPPRIDSTIKVQLPSSAAKTYRELEKEFLIKLDTGEVTAQSAAILSNKLLQASGGAIYLDGGGWEEIHRVKIDALKEIVEKADGDPILLAYPFKSDLERLRREFPYLVDVKDRDTSISEWNAGEIKLFSTHPKSASHGLNLQFGGRIVIWFGPTWSLGLYKQFNARLHRSGQGRPVLVYHIISEGTIEETVMSVLGSKDESQKALLKALVKDAKRRILIGCAAVTT